MSNKLMVDYGWKKGGLIEFISERFDTYYWGRSIPKPIKKDKREFIIYCGTDEFEQINEKIKKLLNE
jgi:hypothetical protein